MSEITVTPRNFKEDQTLQAGTTHKVVVKTFTRRIIEIEDLHFHHNSAVMLPDYVDYDDTERVEKQHVSGIEMLARCYTEAKNNASQKALIAGHTDTTGDAGYNLGLSRLRARNVHSILMGEKKAWVDICMDRHKTEDIQQILKWIVATWAWDCDPGEVNDEMNSQTRSAIKQFQQRYNKEYNAKLPEIGVMEQKTWGAFFDLYLVNLSDTLNTDDAGLENYRKQVHFLEDTHKTVGCGENFPIENRGVDSFKSATNRRVEVLFFDPGEEPKMDCHPSATKCNPSVCQVNNPKMFKPKHVEIKPVPPPQPEFGIVKIDDHFAPSKEELTIEYNVKDAEKESIKLQIYAGFYDYKTKAQTLIFEHQLTGDEKKAGDNKAFSKPWKGEIKEGPDKDKKLYINPLMAPFTVKLSGGGKESTASFKVLYDSITIKKGPWTPDEGEPPEGSKEAEWVQYKLNELGYYGGPVGKDIESYQKKAIIRYKANHKKLHSLDYSSYDDSITATLKKALKDKDNARAKFLTEDAFSDSSKESQILVEALTYEAGEFTDPKVPKEQERLNRPLIPVEVDIYLKKKDNTKELVPEAVGPIRVNWRFTDPDEDLSIQYEKKDGEPSMTKKFIEACLKLKNGLTGSNGDNCHKNYAGIRDDAKNWVTPFLLGDSYIPHTLKEDSGNKVVYSLACVDTAKFPKRVGKAGVHFRPSYVAGDDYKLIAELDFADLPNKTELETYHGVTADLKSRIRKETGTFRIRRFNKVAVHVSWPARKNSSQWDEIKKEFNQAYLDVDVSGIVEKKITDVMTQDEYKQIITTKTSHTDASKVTLHDDSMVGVALPAQGTLNASSYKDALRTFVVTNYWDNIKRELNKPISKNVRKEYPNGFIIVDYLSHKPVNIVNDPSPKSAGDPSPKDPTVTPGNTHFVTWAGSIGLPDSVILADQKDPDKVYYVVGHEMGHNLWLHHWEHAGGYSPKEHDLADHNCIMSYSAGSGFQAQSVYTPHFCGKCNLRLRGWDVEHADIPSASQAPSAAPSVAITVNDPTPEEDDTVHYVIRVTNAGPDNASGVKVKDVLPSGLTFVDYKSSNGDYDSTTGEWDVGMVFIESGEWLTINATVDGGSRGKTITNTATITASDFPAATASSQVDIKVKSADLRVSATVDNATPAEGDTLKYQVTVTNHGPSDAIGLEITTPFSAGKFHLVSTSAEQGTFDGGSQTWNLGKVANGVSKKITLEMKPLAGTKGESITLKATIDAYSPEGPSTVVYSATTSITVKT